MVFSRLLHTCSGEWLLFRSDCHHLLHLWNPLFERLPNAR